ncbi:hypothetical protein CKAH01_10381 [Colletotrichum kahawae]|uniref:Uncharacterized protein n=1 Tax=Colletotrichum kahawae TaxID=34407 RepID=A0AAD9XVY7_COLKA|nr:hypothetical protein CKAH01_10381 [Colletotrichum kahawae]
MFYSYCCSLGKRYKLLLRSEVYSKYTYLGQSYDTAADAVYAYSFLANPVVVNCLLDEAARLEDAEVAEEEVLRKKATALHAAQAELDKSIAQLDRLYKQKQIVFRKGREVTEEESAMSPILEVQSIGGFKVLDIDSILNWNPATPNFLSGES